MPSKARLYAEVILPLPLFGTFTYSIPTTLEGKAAVGHRVIVPFGRKKYYTGIIESITPVAPEGFEVKDISSVLDPWPVVKHPQLKLWEWIAEYYLCTAGDVYKAAVPAGLKVESETFIELNPDYEEMPDARMTDREAIIMQSLDHNGKMTPAEISKKTGLNSIESTISSMVERRMLIIAEKLIERYRPKKETLVRLAVDRNDNEAMHKVFDAVKGAKKQEMMLITLLDNLNKRQQQQLPPEVPRQHLLEQSGLSPAILAALASKGIVEIFTREINRFNYTGTEQGELPKLSAPQSEALDSIHRMFIDKNVTLLHGVTSSGKTEIYIHLIDYILKKGSQALYLVPEIALTTQLTRRLQKVFGKRVIIYHSKFSDNERVDIWKRMLHDPSPCVVIGARSSLFLPFSRLGLVIVDEEHESSYKQFDPAPRYNARDCAIVLASMHGAKTLLGSATPAIETYYKALNGRYGLVTLSERYEGVQLPLIEIVDLNDERRRGRISGPMSARLAMMSREAVKGGEQVILFHNRRGFAPVVVCKQCGYVPKCQNCDVSLTYHRKAGEMVCHYCGATYKLPTICPACKEPAIEVYGYGTERIEEIAESSFPGARIMRMDLDTTRNKDSYLNIINDFSLGKADILVGTQMVTKGLDFERVSLVGILNADNLINFPDFRASERAFNMLEQVAGRAGRRNKRGLVIVQTSQPAHPILSYLQAHNYEGFYEHELEERRRYGYPPFTRVINIYLKHRDEDLLIRAAAGYAETLRHLFGNRILGPDEPHIARIQSLYIRKIMLKVEIQASMSKVKAILRSVYEAQMADKSLRSLVVYYDVDPM
ncbi:primosomal protein N' [Muribaculum sp. NM65_B17]|jgi:primosomal protein N' (replication factor Y)|uniref:replication restart helicase PriA n=4 Tax=Muribaculum TaxID=1918540 RepID=UPI001093BBD1|nr:primosomal protein N' [Muribaculum sp. NM65_B17]TGY04715.1 primosomal protein N' [Muribaculum sp. NM65_B17]THG43966.1 primosomal protein N' [Muribaculaceae bacterium]